MKPERSPQRNAKNGKRKRRHTRVQLDSLRPILIDCHNSQCPKCNGHVRIEPGESINQIIKRCLNCGWQPNYQTPIIHETEESRMLRFLTTQFVSDLNRDRIPVTF